MARSPGIRRTFMEYGTSRMVARRNRDIVWLIGESELHPSTVDRDCNRRCVVTYAACVRIGLPTNNITHSGCLCIPRLDLAAE